MFLVSLFIACFAKTAPAQQNLCDRYGSDLPPSKPPDALINKQIIDCSLEAADQLAAGPDNAEIIANAIGDICDYRIAYAAAIAWKKNPSSDIEEWKKDFRKMATDRARIEVLRQRAGHCANAKNSK